jgi:predicted nucleic acid-binding protein
VARAAVATHLIDTSAQARVAQPLVAARVEPLLAAGVLATCTVLDLECLRGARSPAQYDEVHAERDLLYERLPLEQPVFTRAIEVQQRLAELGRHRTVPVADLVIAAVAERHGLTLLHYDRDFDRIAAITGQTVEWVVPRGSAD